MKNIPADCNVVEFDAEPGTDDSMRPGADAGGTTAMLSLTVGGSARAADTDDGGTDTRTSRPNTPWIVMAGRPLAGRNASCSVSGFKGSGMTYAATPAWNIAEPIDANELKHATNKI